MWEGEEGSDGVGEQSPSDEVGSVVNRSDIPQWRFTDFRLALFDS